MTEIIQKIIGVGIRRLNISIILLMVICPLNGQDIDHWESIIKIGDSVKYFTPDSELPESWNGLDFDDSEWIDGISGIGYGDEDDNTIISNTLSVYLRFSFNIASLSEIEQLILDMDFDDGFVAYLNGGEIARSNMGAPNEPTTFDQLTETYIEANLYQGNPPARFDISNEDLGNLKTGINILAIEVHNQSSTSSDLSSNTFLHAGISGTSSYYKEVPEWFIAPFSSGSSKLPLILINTEGKTILNDPRIIANMGIVDNGSGAENNITDSMNIYQGRISIEIRGASSQMFPKKSYTIETQTNSGTNNNISILGLPPENDYVLYAPYSDKSLLRNVISYRLYEKMGHWSPRTRFVELYLNEIYQGIYVLTEKIKQDVFRVDIGTLTAADVSTEAISGGYILQVDRTDNLVYNEYWTSPTSPPYSNFKQNTFEYYDPKRAELSLEQATYMRHWINEFDALMASPNFLESNGGYRDYIDISSFVDYLIFHEINKDVDAYRLSEFFYKAKDEDGGKLHAGPPWDYNLTYGNMDYGGDIVNTYNWLYTKTLSTFWWRRLLEDDWFQNMVYCRWDQLNYDTGIDEQLNAMIDSSIALLGASIDYNFQQWPILGSYIWPNSFIGNTHAEEILFLKSWIEDRISWLDNIWGGKCDESLINLSEIDEISQLSIYPNPSNLSYTKIRLPEMYSGQYQINIYNIQGKEVYHQEGQVVMNNRILIDDVSQLPGGIYLIKFSAEGKYNYTDKLIRQ